jgi:hypothetical protein
MTRLPLPYLALALLSLRPAAAQSSRAEEIERARDDKQKALRPEQLDPAEAWFRKFQDEKYLERFSAGYNGLRAKIGNMVTGAGFAIGPEYFREDLFDGRLRSATGVQGSFSGSYRFSTDWQYKPRRDDRFVLFTYAEHRNFSRVNYYGPGPDSAKTGRSNYRLEDRMWEAGGLSRPLKWLRTGATFGLDFYNVGPGADQRLASAERLYSPAVAPGMDRQTDYLRGTLLAQIDYRDNPNGPKTGGNYVVQQTWFHDRTLGQYGFRRLDVDLQQYIGLFNSTRRLALRARTVLTETGGGQRVPFYLQPVLGGSDDLRGFRPFRFSGQNLLSTTAEYRWEIFAGLDGALFWDGGKVFARRGQLNFSNIESSVGVGLRFNARNSTFIRLDAGFSHEGFQFWIKFNDPFLPQPYGTPFRQPAY